MVSEAANPELMRLEVSGFPLHVGMSVKASFWKNFRTDFAPVADTAIKDTNIRVYVRSQEDLKEYNPKSHDDALEMGLDKSRDLSVALQLESIGVPEKQIFYLRPDPPMGRGPQFRKVTVTVTREILPDYVTRKELMEILANLPKPEPAPAPRKDTVVLKQNRSAVWLGIGATYSTFGKVMPILQGQVGNHRIRFVAEVGHTIYSYDQQYGTTSYDVQNRLVSCFLAYRPFWKASLELLGGWHRTEEYAWRYGKYTRKDEGLELGLRLTPIRHLALEAVWSPDERSIIGDEFVHWHADHLRVSIFLFTSIFGGGK